MSRFNFDGNDDAVNEKIGEFLLTLRDGAAYVQFRNDFEQNGPEWFQNQIVDIIKSVYPEFEIGGGDKFIPVFDGPPSGGGDRLFHFVIPDPDRLPSVGSLSGAERDEYQSFVGRIFLGPCG